MASEQNFIVGLGVPAAESASLAEFFTRLPPKPGLALLLMPQGRPDLHHQLSDWLDRATPLPVITAEDQLEVLPDRIYLIPPELMMTVREGRLQLLGPVGQDDHGGSSVDHFFFSLAENCGKNAVCVILAENGSDGWLSLAAVKERGGLTVARSPRPLQSPVLAARSRHAIESGLVDIVAEAGQMPGAIIDLTSRSSRPVENGRIPPDRTGDGRLDEISTTRFDLATPNRTRQDLQIMEPMLRLVADSVPALIFYVDGEQTIRYCNAGYRDWLDLDRDQLIGRTLRKVVGESAWRTLESQVRKALAGELVELSTYLSFRSGPDKYVKLQYHPQLNENGTVAGFIAYVQDQTDKLEHQRNSGRLAAIVNSSQEAIVGFNLDGRITDWNRGAEDLYGHSAQEALGTHFLPFLPKDRQWAAEENFQRLIRGENLEPLETRVLTKDGAIKTIRLNLSPIQSEDNQILGISALAHDITKRIAAEQALAEMNQHLEQRVAERTRQLRNLTARFLGFEQTERRKFSRFLHDEIQQTLAAAKLLIEQALLSADQEKTAPPLSESLRLLNEAIEHTRIITTDLSPPLFFDTGISTCLHWLKRWALAKYELQVQVSLEGRDRPIGEEAGYLCYRCLRELLFNVYKHAGVKKAVLSAQFEDDGTLGLTVTDQGAGFDPRRLEKQVTTHFGILSLVEQLEAIKGSISIDSDKDAGTRISISLPRSFLAPSPAVSDRPGTRQQEPAQEMAQPGEDDGKTVILIVDDQADLRFTLRLMLEDLCSDYQFLEAESAEQAVEIVRQHRPHLVLMDVSMPGLGGVEATRMIREESEDIIVIGLSMHEREDMEKIMREAGASDYLTKDSSSEVILSAIRKWLTTGP